LQIKILVH